MMKTVATTDIVIIGGGIAGLWLLNRLRLDGLSVILFESNTLGGGQTQKSQGIIHGGMKYALQGKMTSEANALSQVPEKWRSCLEGRGEVDLRHVPILSDQQFLWSTHKFTSKLTGFFASATLESKVSAIKKDDYPMVFKHPAFKGELFTLNEMVLDIPSLIRELVKANQDAVYKIEPLSESEMHFDGDGKLASITAFQSGKSIEVKAQFFIFVAGSGNELIVRRFESKKVSMQRRPLHMVLAKVPHKLSLYAHCLGLSTRPRVTITTHVLQDGQLVWYLGGALAEEGVHKSSQQQIQAARSELSQLFPWLDFTGTEFATFMIDRAEAMQKNGFKPESFHYQTIGNTIIAWPTKLALAPMLADSIANDLKSKAILPQFMDLRELRAWPMPAIAAPIWEEAFCKSVA